MIQPTKYLTTILALLIVIATGYAGLVIYNSKHNHSGSNAFASLFGRDKPKVTNNSAYAQQAIKLHDQYSSNNAAVKPTSTNEDGQRLVIVNFFDEYLKNLAAHQNQDAVIAKYGTSNLADQYKNASPSYDPFTCSAGDPAPTMMTLGAKGSDNTYTADFRTSKAPVSTSQVTVTNVNNTSLVDSVACLMSD